MVDGVDNNDPSVTGFSSPVIQEAVQEFTLLTNLFSAEYGHSTAGQFITTTKSGTNAYHGEGWYYGQNRNLNSLDNITRSTTAPGSPYPRYDRNRFGGQMGGPVIKDKVFFFGAYEYRDLTLAGTPTGSILVPTAGGLAQLDSLAANAGSGVSPINVGILKSLVPAAPIQSSAVPVLNQATGQTVQIPVGTFSATTPNFDRSHLFLISGDYQTAKHRISSRVHYSHNPFVSAGSLPVVQFNSNRSVDTRRVTLADVWSVSASVLNEFRFGYNRYLSNSPVDLPQAPGATDVFGNYTVAELSLNVGPQSNFPQSRFQNVYSWTDNVSWIRGAHAFKYGIDVHNIIAAGGFLPRARGDFQWPTLDAFVRDQFPANVAIRGVGTAQFVQSRPAVYFFGQDSWKLMPRLTLEMGLRYEYTGVPRDTSLQDLNALANITSIRNETNAQGVKIFDTLPKYFQDALVNFVGDSVIFQKPKTDTNNWAPRVGIAWDVRGDGKTSVRAGFGMAYDFIFGNFAVNSLPPQFQVENRDSNACLLNPRPAWCAVAINPANPAAGGVQYSTIGFLAGGGLMPVLPTTTLTDKSAARSVTGSYMVNDKIPETFTWSLSIQHQLAKDYLVEVRYLGNHAIYLPMQVQLNNGVPNPIQLPIFANQSDALARNYAGAATLAQFNANTRRLLAPYGFNGALTEFPPDGQSWYNGASVELVRRFSHGVQLNTNYTWSKTIDLIENELFTSQINPRRAFDSFDFLGSKGLSGLNHSHKYTMAWIYEVPKFTRGNAWVNGLLSGWGMNGTYVAETGQAVSTLSFADLNGNLDTAGDPAFENPNGVRGTGSGVNFVCFGGGGASISTTAAGCGGSTGIVGYVAKNPNAQFVKGATGAMQGVGLTLTGRGNVNAAGVNNWNFSFYKSTPLVGEGRSLRLGISLWNAFNHPSFAIGNGGAIPDPSNNNATNFPGYVDPGSPQFLNKTIFSGGLGQSPFQRVISLEAKLFF